MASVSGEYDGGGADLDRRAVALLGLIEAAFPPRALGDGVSLSQALLADDWSDDPAQLRAAKAADTTGDWRDVSEAALERAFAACSVYTYLDDDGIAFYLPAALRNPLGDVEYWTADYLTRAPTARGGRVAEETVAALDLTSAQARCVALTLAWLLALHDRDGTPLIGRNPVERERIGEWVAAYG